MANDEIYISDLPAQSGDITALTQVLAQDDGTTTKKVTVAQIAKAIIESFTGSSLGGSARSIKSAIDAIVQALKSKDYSTVSTLYNAGLTNLFTFGTATGTLMSELTNGQQSNAGRFIMTKADDTTVDILFFSAGNGKLFTVRIANGVVTRAYYINMTQISL